VKLTDEQESILNSAKNMEFGDVLVVNALAGCGKTSTLKEIAKNIKNANFLYLAFNRSVIDEAKKKFDKTNVQPYTMSGFARRFVNQDNDPKGNIFDFIKEALNITDGRKWGIREAYLEVCKSDIPISEVWNHREQFLDDYRLELEKTDIPNPQYWIEQREEALKYIKPLHESIINHPTYTTFQSYEKEFIDRYAENPDRYYLDYEYIVVDEAQDTSKLFSKFLFSAIKTKKFKTILVGDNNQKIYGWRGDIDLFGESKKLFPVKEEKLSKTFRFKSQSDIEREANHILNMRNQNIIGFRTQETNDKQTAFLSRTNIVLFKLALDFIQKGQDYRFDTKNFENEKRDTSSIYQLFLHTKELINKLENVPITQLQEYQYRGKNYKEKKNLEKAKKLISEYFHKDRIEKITSGYKTDTKGKVVHISEGEIINILKGFKDYIRFPNLGKLRYFTSFLHLKNFLKSGKNPDLNRQLKIAIFIYLKRDAVNSSEHSNVVEEFFKLIEKHSNQASERVLANFHTAKGLGFRDVKIVNSLSVIDRDLCEWDIYESARENILGLKDDGISVSIKDKDRLDIEYEFKKPLAEKYEYFTSNGINKVLEFDSFISDLKEEYNMLYVGITRAIENLHIEHSTYQFTLKFLEYLKDKSLDELINGEVQRIDREKKELTVITGLNFRGRFIPKNILEEFLATIK